MAFVRVTEKFINTKNTHAHRAHCTGSDWRGFKFVSVSQERGFGGVAGIPFFHFYTIFLHEFLRDRNSCIYSGFLRNPEDSCRFG
jgi:hypothetical protein